MIQYNFRLIQKYGSHVLECDIVRTHIARSCVDALARVCKRTNRTGPSQGIRLCVIQTVRVNNC
jgi:hypothetical protein